MLRLLRIRTPPEKTGIFRRCAPTLRERPGVGYPLRLGQQSGGFV